MAKIRVQQLAKELNVPVQEIMKKLEGLGIFVPNPMSTLEPAEVVKIKSLITGKKITMVRKKVVKNAPEAQNNQASPKAESKKEAVQEQPVKAEQPKAKPEAAPQPEKKPEPVKAETPKAEQPKAEPEKTEAPKAEKPRTEGKPQQPAGKEAAAKPAQNNKQETIKRTDRPAADANRKNTGERRDNRDNRDSRDNNRTNRDNRQSRDGQTGGKTGQERRSGQSRDNRNTTGERRDNRSGDSRQERRSDNRDSIRSSRSTDTRQDRGERRYNNGEGRQDKDSRRFGDSQNGRDGQSGQNRSSSGRRSDTRRSSGSAYDGGLSIPDRPKIDDKPVKKRENIRKDKEKQKNNASEEYKNKKNKLIQESSFLDDDRLARHKKKGPKKPMDRQTVQEEEISIVALPETLTVKELADALHKPINQIIKALMGKGIMAGLNQMIEFEQAEELAMDLGILVEHQVEEDIFARYANPVDEEEDLETRPPVVVVMGHVDHGKTSLLDAIRNTKVTEGEAGGITQHIGASVVEIDGRKITFLDTPGHEAFTAMRLRGAQVTDIAILVVAADDGVMPQTIEAINHAKAAGVQIIVAINKMDKPSANPERVKQELTEYGLIAEEWGGSTICVPVSAKKREGIDNLLEMVLLVADMGELKANKHCLASGTVIESQLDKGRGSVATVLVQRGTLHVGDTIVAGSSFGRVKAMVDDKGRRVKEAGPSKPVEIIGLNEVPAAGETFYMTETEREARMLAEKVSARERAKLLEGNKKVNLNDLFGDIQSGNMKELNIVVKADVQGSVEAVKQSLEKLSNEEVTVKVIHGAVGAVNESDVMLASASNSIIIGFNVRPDAAAKSAAEEQKVDLRLYRVIYNAIEDIEAAMKGMLDPEFEEKVIGHAEVRQVFKASGVGTIAGSYVLDGKISRNASARLVRDGIVVYEGTMASLRRFKDDVKEVNAGYECGIMLEKFSDIKEGDTIEAFVMEEVKR